MGLDMYLYADTSVSRVYFPQNADSYDSVEKSPVFEEIASLLGVKDLLTDEWVSMQVRVPVAYWRKANAIHNWIVNACAGGKDECQEIYISPEKAQELVDLCEQVLSVRTSQYSASMLPTASGFFFGGTDYDDWYYKDVEHTRDVFRTLLEYNSVNQVFDRVIYQASW